MRKIILSVSYLFLASTLKAQINRVEELQEITPKSFKIIHNADSVITYVVQTRCSSGGASLFLRSTKELPLYVIDDLIVKQKKVKKLDPNRIASIEILEGEAALKKYGAKGKNSVVIINTKK